MFVLEQNARPSHIVLALETYYYELGSGLKTNEKCDPTKIGRQFGS